MSESAKIEMPSSKPNLATRLKNTSKDFEKQQAGQPNCRLARASDSSEFSRLLRDYSMSSGIEKLRLSRELRSRLWDGETAQRVGNAKALANTCNPLAWEFLRELRQDSKLGHVVIFQAPKVMDASNFSEITKMVEAGMAHEADAAIRSRAAENFISNLASRNLGSASLRGERFEISPGFAQASALSHPVLPVGLQGDAARQDGATLENALSAASAGEFAKSYGNFQAPPAASSEFAPPLNPASLRAPFPEAPQAQDFSADIVLMSKWRDGDFLRQIFIVSSLILAEGKRKKQLEEQGKRLNPDEEARFQKLSQDLRKLTGPDASFRRLLDDYIGLQLRNLPSAG